MSAEQPPKALSPEEEPKAEASPSIKIEDNEATPESLASENVEGRKQEVLERLAVQNENKEKVAIITGKAAEIVSKESTSQTTRTPKAAKSRGGSGAWKPVGKVTAPAIIGGLAFATPSVASALGFTTFIQSTAPVFGYSVGSLTALPAAIGLAFFGYAGYNLWKGRKELFDELRAHISAPFTGKAPPKGAASHGAAPKKAPAAKSGGGDHGGGHGGGH